MSDGRHKPRQGGAVTQERHAHEVCGGYQFSYE